MRSHRIFHFLFSLFFLKFHFDLRSEVSSEGVSDDHIAELEENHVCRCLWVVKEGGKGEWRLGKNSLFFLFFSKKTLHTDQSKHFVIYFSQHQPHKSLL